MSFWLNTFHRLERFKMNNEPVAWIVDGKIIYPAKTLTDEEIWAVANDYFVGKSDLVYGFARAILRKAQEK